MKSWIIPEYKLDPDIRSILDSRINGNICISGFIKTGKTTTMLCIMKRILNEKPNSRILFWAFSNTLVKMFKKVFREFGIQANVETFWKFKNNQSHYDYIICDDVHLMGPSLLNEVKDKANIVIVSISPYLTFFDETSLTKENPVTLDQVKEILVPKVFELHHLHFNPADSIIEFSKALLNGDLGIRLPIRNITRTQQKVQICEAQSKEEEYKFVFNNTQKLLPLGYTTAILFPTNRLILSFVQSIIKMSGKEPWVEKQDRWERIDFSDLNKYLSSIGLNYQCLGSGFGDLESIDTKINIMTYYGALGFQFDYVYMPNLNSDLFISYNESISRSIFVYALSRSRMNHYLVYSGLMHDYLQRIKAYYRFIQDDNVSETDWFII